MNDSTIRLSTDTSALTDSLSKIDEEMTSMKDAVSSSAAAMSANLKVNIDDNLFNSLRINVR